MTGCHVQPEQMFNLIFGYNSRVTDYIAHDTDAAGAFDHYFTAVPANVIYVVQTIWCQPRESAGSYAYLGLKDGTNDHWLGVSAALANYVPYSVNGQYVLKEGDQVKVTVSGGGAIKEFWIGYWGYKMVLTQ